MVGKKEVTMHEKSILFYFLLPYITEIVEYINNNNIRKKELPLWMILCGEIWNFCVNTIATDDNIQSYPGSSYFVWNNQPGFDNCFEGELCLPLIMDDDYLSESRHLRKELLDKIYYFLYENKIVDSPNVPKHEKLKGLGRAKARIKK